MLETSIGIGMAIILVVGLRIYYILQQDKKYEQYLSYQQKHPFIQ